MTRGRGGRGGRGGQSGGDSNRFFDFKQNGSNNHGRDRNVHAGFRSSENHRSRGNFTARGGNRGLRVGNRGGTSGYNRRPDWTGNHNTDSGVHYQQNLLDQGAYNEDENGQNIGFKKFRDPNASSSVGNNFRQSNYNSSNRWYRDNLGDYSKKSSTKLNVSQTEIAPGELPTNIQPPEKRASVAVQPPPICLKATTESREPELIRKIKTEKFKSDSPSPKPKSKKLDKPNRQESSSSSSSSSEEDEPQPPTNKAKTKEKIKPTPNIKIKKEHVAVNENKKTAKEALPVPPSPSTQSSSSESSSSNSSSSEEEEIPKMPQSFRNADAAKPKKERTSEDDVVCLGKPRNIENLIDDDEKSQTQPCMVCNKKDHSFYECQMKCTKCSHSSYECQMVCKNCGETYGQNLKTLPKPPNPFVMFMQFMQYCMSQYYDSNSEIKYPFPQFECASAPVQGPAQTVEVTRKDIANLNRDRKRTKSGSKQSRKRVRASMNSDNESDSESSSKATTSTSTKKRKKKAKSVSREVEAPPAGQQQQFPPFGAQFPANMPFTGSFNASGYNPMLAFSQMMGFNPSIMNFPR